MKTKALQGYVEEIERRKVYATFYSSSTEIHEGSHTGELWAIVLEEFGKRELWRDEAYETEKKV